MVTGAVRWVLIRDRGFDEERNASGWMNSYSRAGSMARSNGVECRHTGSLHVQRVRNLGVSLGSGRAANLGRERHVSV